MASILLVDDHPALRHALSRYLRMFGHAVTDAATAEEALERLESIDPDVVVTDLNLPRMRGTELVERLRARGVAAPVILMSGDRPADEEASAAALVLLKPFGPAELCSAIDEALGTAETDSGEIGLA